MATFDQAGDAVRKIAGYLPYNPGPGIYSRLEKAIEQMPANVRVQELPGLLKRYKDGVPGWELKAADFDSLTAGRDAVAREELLSRVKERSPVYTHGEMVLGETGPVYKDQPHYSLTGFGGHPLLDDVPAYQEGPSRLGRGVLHGTPKYGEYGQGGKDYKELLLIQPGAGDNEFSTHWGGSAGNAVAHARFDTHGDALRINELQSDLGIHNRKVREAISSRQGPPQQLPSESDSTYLDRAQEQGYVMQMGDDGEWQWSNDPKSQGIDFPMEDDWLDLLIKRVALEAARGGHRAIEIASPRSIADKVGGNIENYEHVYNKVAPGRLERLGRKMGGLVEEAPVHTSWTLDPWDKELSTIRNQALMAIPRDADGAYRSLVNAYSMGDSPRHISLMARDLEARVPAAYAHEMPEYVSLAEREGAARRARREAKREYDFMDGAMPPSRRYIMSDEMRRRIITQGIGAAVAAPMMSDDDLIERLNK
jgi:hypothetical protein